MDNRPAETKVLLVSMPFGPLFLPSIGLGLLKSTLVSRQITTKEIYFTFQLAERIGALRYLNISNGEHSTSDLLGEWIFARSLFGSDPDGERRYIDDVVLGGSHAHSKRFSNFGSSPVDVTKSFVQEILQLRDQEEFLNECVEQVLALSPRVLGLTSVFQQQVASLALAQRVKLRSPETFIVMGGANCEGAMGLEIIKQFAFVDAVVSGEGETVFPDLVEAVLAGNSVGLMPGVHTRARSHLTLFSASPSNAPSIQEMDRLPYPDYDGFFEQFESSRKRLDVAYTPHVLFETSRGCWWAKAAHCTFCGLNGSNMNFRSKSAPRAMEELTHLTQRYPGCPVTVVDNILDMSYFRSFIPDLAARKMNLQMFYEVKSNLKRDQVRLLRDAGIRAIQPGIESLSTSILEQMRKGCTKLQNVQLLKWCKEFGVRAIWNILWGFPAESPDEYRLMAELIPLLVHLDPPQTAAPLRLDRFSPNFDHSSEFGFSNVKPYPSYFHVYPFAPEAVANLAYYFTFEYAQPQEPAVYTEPLLRAVASWQQHRSLSDLFSVDLDSHLVVYDARHAGLGRFYVLDTLSRALYLACERIQGSTSLRALDTSALGPHRSTEDVFILLDTLVESGLMLRENESYLSLAVPLGDYKPAKSTREHFINTVRAVGAAKEDHWVVPERCLNRIGGRDTENMVRRSTPDPMQLSPGHFFFEQGELAIDLAPLEMIDCNSVTMQLFQMAAGHA